MERHFGFCVGLQGKYPIGKGEQAIPLSVQDRETIVVGLRALRSAVEGTGLLLAPLARELPALHDNPISTRSIVAASWAEATMEVAKAHLKGFEGWERFDQLDPQGQQQQFRACFNSLPDAPQIRASLKIEAAKLRRHVLAASMDNRYGVILRDLAPQSRALLELLIEREGEMVETADVAERLFGDSAVPGGTLRQAVHRLRGELRALGYLRTAGLVRTERGGYSLALDRGRGS